MLEREKYFGAAAVRGVGGAAFGGLSAAVRGLGASIPQTPNMPQSPNLDGN